MEKQEKRSPARVGGQAVIEGIMMKGPKFYTTACRTPEGKIVRQRKLWQSVTKKHKVLGLPIIRGIINFVETLIVSMQTLTYSAEMQDEEVQKSKFELWLEKTFGASLMGFVSVIGTVLGVALAFGLFFYLPMLISKLLQNFFDMPRIVKSLVEGLVKIAIFVGYVAVVALMPDIRRTYEYHGAEHKSIFCFEKGLELNVENVKAQKRFHPRCGTSFIFMMLILGIIVSALLPQSLWENLFLRVGVRLLIFPLIVGIGYEITIFSGTHDSFIIRLLTAPGLWLQRITTREPDHSEIEVAIVALKSSLPDMFGEDDVKANIENVVDLDDNEKKDN